MSLYAMRRVAMEYLKKTEGNCPRCSSARVSQTSKTRWKCAACGKAFTRRASTASAQK